MNFIIIFIDDNIFLQSRFIRRLLLLQLFHFIGALFDPFRAFKTFDFRNRRQPRFGPLLLLHLVLLPAAARRYIVQAPVQIYTHRRFRYAAFLTCRIEIVIGILEPVLIPVCVRINIVRFQRRCSVFRQRFVQVQAVIPAVPRRSASALVNMRDPEPEHRIAPRHVLERYRRVARRHVELPDQPACQRELLLDLLRLPVDEILDLHRRSVRPARVEFRIHRIVKIRPHLHREVPCRVFECRRYRHFLPACRRQ